MQNFKNVKVKAMKMRKVKALTTIKVKSTAKVNKVKAIERTLTGFRIEGEKQVNKKIGSELAITLPSHFTNMFNRPVFIYTYIIFTIFIFKNLNTVVSDPSDHHFQTFTVGNLSDCKMFCLPRQTASIQAETVVKTLANPDSIRLFKLPETRPDLRSIHLTLVPNHLLSGQVRKSETNLFHDSFIQPT
jgi:hypothetical protein